MSANFKPVKDWVFIEPFWDEEEQYHGLYLPNVRQRDLPNTGTVKAIPEGCNTEFAVGDFVVFNRHNQQLTDVPGNKVTMTRVKVEDVMAVIDLPKQAPK